MAVKAAVSSIVVPQLALGQIPVTIVSLSPLIFHKWSEKAKKQIRDKQAKVAKVKGHEIRDAKKEYEDSFYYDSEGDIAFPALCLKKAIINAGRFVEDFPMTIIRGAIFVAGDKDGFIKVKFDEKIMREDMVRVGMGSADLRYRGEVRDWSMHFNVDFNASILSEAQVLNLIRVAGYSVGIGEWRPEKSGDYGRFTLEQFKA